MTNRSSGIPGRIAYTIVLPATFLAVTGALLAVACVDLAATRRELAESAAAAAPRVERALREGDSAHALDGIPSIASAKLYAADGRLLAGTPPAPPLRPGLAAGLTARLAPNEIVCGRTAVGDTFCREPSAVPLAVRVGWWLQVIGWGALAGAALGLLAGWLVRRALQRREQPMVDLLEQAERERDSLQKRETELRRRTLELETLNKDLEGFAHTVSHDLRGPLGSVDGFAQALEVETRGQLEPATAEYIHWIREGCRQMHQLIDGLLEMARLARAEIAQDEVDLSSIARSVAEELRQRAPQRQVRFEIRDGARTVGDPRLLRAVVENLMSNAFKFTRGRDEARIEFGMVHNGSGPAFYVRDNGAGFDPSQAAKMFRPFQRLHSSREFEGTGIGLATVQKIVMLHGGTAWAEGEVGKGATIWFTAGGDRGAVPA